MTIQADIQITSVSHTKELLLIEWADGEISRLDALWLRDHCQMPVSRNPDNGQRLLNVIDIPENVSIEEVKQLSDLELEIVFFPEKHISVFTSQWLRNNCYCLNAACDDRSAGHKLLWHKDSFTQGLPGNAYSEFANRDDCKIDTLQAFSNYGFARITELPCEPRQVLKLINQFGFNRKTNYGELFEVQTEINPNNLAYSNLGLGCHTDNPYRDPVPTIQLLHCLSNSAAGGNSILIDGFYAAKLLQRESPQHFATLVENWINFRFSDAESELHSRAPMIETNDLGEVVRVRYNNRSIASIRLPADKIRQFYAAYRHFGEILERDSLKIVFRLEPGHVVLFDNTRVMHARTAFSSEGERHLQGAYADLDGLYSTLNVLKRSA